MIKYKILQLSFWEESSYFLCNEPIRGAEQTALSVPAFRQHHPQEYVMGRLIEKIIKFMGNEKPVAERITEKERNEADQFTSMLACFMNDESYLRYRKWRKIPPGQVPARLLRPGYCL